MPPFAFPLEPHTYLQPMVTMNSDIYSILLLRLFQPPKNGIIEIKIVFLFIHKSPTGLA